MGFVSQIHRRTDWTTCVTDVYIAVPHCNSDHSQDGGWSRKQSRPTNTANYVIDGQYRFAVMATRAAEPPFANGHRWSYGNARTH